MGYRLYVEPNWVSPYVFACFVTLREKDLEFEAFVLDSSAGDTKSADYLGQCITGRVPSLLDDEFGLAESSAIVEYLDEKHPEPPVLPASTRDRARCRQLMSWLRSDDTAPIREERSTLTMFYGRSDKPLSDAAAHAAKKLVDVTGRLIRAGDPWIFDRWTILDAELAFMLHRLILNNDPVPRGVAKWAEAQWERPSVRAFRSLARPALTSSVHPPSLPKPPSAR